MVTITDDLLETNSTFEGNLEQRQFQDVRFKTQQGQGAHVPLRRRRQVLPWNRGRGSVLTERFSTGVTSRLHIERALTG